MCGPACALLLPLCLYLTSHEPAGGRQRPLVPSQTSHGVGWASAVSASVAAWEEPHDVAIAERPAAGGTTTIRNTKERLEVARSCTTLPPTPPRTPLTRHGLAF